MNPLCDLQVDPWWGSGTNNTGRSKFTTSQTQNTRPGNRWLTGDKTSASLWVQNEIRSFSTTFWRVSGVFSSFVVPAVAQEGEQVFCSVPPVLQSAYQGVLEPWSPNLQRHKCSVPLRASDVSLQPLFMSWWRATTWMMKMYEEYKWEFSSSSVWSVVLFRLSSGSAASQWNTCSWISFDFSVTKVLLTQKNIFRFLHFASV